MDGKAAHLPAARLAKAIWNQYGAAVMEEWEARLKEKGMDGLQK